MTFTRVKTVRQRVDRILALLQEQRHSALQLNAYALVVNQAASAGFGLLYWMVAARLYSAEIVGENSAIISTLMFLAALATLSLNSAMIRYIPRAGARTPQLVLRVYGINVIAAALISIVFLQAGQRLLSTAGLVGGSGIDIAWLVVATIVWCIFYVQDGVLIGLRQSVWVLIENSLFNVVKIGVLIACVALSLDHGIALSWFLPAGLLVLLTNGLIFWRFMPKHVAASGSQSYSLTARQALPSVTGDYFGSMLLEMCVRMLPLLVVSMLGKAAGAYFYQAWVVSTPLLLISSNMVSSFTVESAVDMSKMANYSRRILRQMAFMIVPAAAVVIVAAPQILGLFGEAYAREGVLLLCCLGLAAIPAMLNTWYLGYSRVRADAIAIMLCQGAISVLTLGLSYWWLPTYGISSIGVAWLASQTLVAVVVLSKASSFLRGETDHEEAANPAVSSNHLWRRADWRFLSSMPRPRISAVFTGGLLAKSVAAVSEQVLDGNVASRGESDLAVAVNPSAATLRSACDVLRDGGVCYTEWSAWRLGGAWGIRRRLRAAGFVHMKLCWPYPSPPLARFWLPLPARRSACRYLANQFIIGDGIIQRLTSGFVARLLQALLWLGLVPHLGTVAYKGSGRTGDLFDFTRKEWARTEGNPDDSRLSFLVQTGGSQLRSKIVCLVFADPDPLPRWVAKLPRVPEDAQTIQHERDIVCRLHSSNGATPAGLVLPHMLHCLEINGVWTSVQTALTGLSLQRKLTRNNFAELAMQVTDWQVTLAKQSSGRTAEIDRGARISQLLAGVDRLPGQMMDARTLAQTWGLLSALGKMPSVCAHNDFTPWNLIGTKAGLGAIDWGDAEWDGMPMLDLVYVLANMAFVVHNAWDTQRMLATYRWLTDVSTPFGAVFQRELSRYAREVGLHSGQIAPLRLLTWVLHRDFECRVEIEQGVKTTHLRPHESVCIPLWKAELRLQLGSNSEERIVEGGMGA